MGIGFIALQKCKIKYNSGKQQQKTPIFIALRSRNKEL